ncbi:MAG: hypothetical protein PHE96_03135 [Methylococcales bacterium]|nr:hypothetical protein [Methylococcales bacterium]
MCNNSTADDFEQEIRDVQTALERAALQARRIAGQTRTALIIVRDGKLIREMIDWDFEKQVER